MASIFNEQRVLGVRVVADGTMLFNWLPVLGVVDAGPTDTFTDSKRVLGVDVLEADVPMHNDQPVRGVVLIEDGRKLYNHMEVIPVRALSGVLE